MGIVRETRTKMAEQVVNQGDADRQQFLLVQKVDNFLWSVSSKPFALHSDDLLKMLREVASENGLTIPDMQGILDQNNRKVDEIHVYMDETDFDIKNAWTGPGAFLGDRNYLHVALKHGDNGVLLMLVVSPDTPEKAQWEVGAVSWLDSTGAGEWDSDPDGFTVQRGYSLLNWLCLVGDKADTKLSAALRGRLLNLQDRNDL